MNSSESLKAVTMIMTIFDVPAWTDEKRDAFRAAIEDLPYESAKQAVATWIRQQPRRPEPADIRRLAEQVEPPHRRLSAPDGAWTPRYHPPGEGVGGNRPPIVRATHAEIETMLEQYASTAGGKMDRPDLAYAARQISRPDLERAFLPEYDVETSVVYGSVPERDRAEHAKLALSLTVDIATSKRATDAERRELLERIAWMHDRWPGVGWDTVYVERARAWGFSESRPEPEPEPEREWYP